MIECLLGVFILSAGAVAFYTLFPTYKQAERLSSQQARAAQIGSRLIEHLQLLKPQNLTASTLTQLNLIDGGQSAPPYSFSHIPLDEASMYSPAQALPNGAGTMSFTNLAGNSVKIDITITWRGPNGNKSLTTGTIVGGYR